MGRAAGRTAREHARVAAAAMASTGCVALVSAGTPSAATGMCAWAITQLRREHASVQGLARWPDTDAILASCGATALGANSVLRSHGLDVPGDVAVTGSDDWPGP